MSVAKERAEFRASVAGILKNFQRRVDRAVDDPEKMRAMRLELREIHGLTFVNAQPYLRRYVPRKKNE